MILTDISIHALLAESDQRLWHFSAITSIFLSTLSLRRATQQNMSNGFMSAISIHALLAESDILYHGLATYSCISIHALLAESDGVFFFLQDNSCNFYPRSPCGERRINSSAEDIATSFLSTLSLRRATGCKQGCGF